MKTILYKMAISGMALVPAALAADQVMIAGWEFSQFTVGGFNSIGDTLDAGGDFSQAGKVKANYSGLLLESTAGGPLAESFGTIYYDGTNGSTNAGLLNSSGGDTVFPFAQDLVSLADQISPPYGSNASQNVLTANGQSIYNEFGLRVDADNTIVIEARAGFTGVDWTLNLAHQTVDGTTGGQTLGFYYKDPSGGSFVQFATQTISGTDTAFTQAIPELDGAQTVQIQVRVSGVSNTNAAILDNIGVYAKEGDLSDPSYWSASPKTGGWRHSRDGYVDEFGIGWIYDDNWPYVYTFGLGDHTDGDWIYIFDGGSRSAFWAYNYDEEYWLQGNSVTGVYYIVGDSAMYFFNP